MAKHAAAARKNDILDAALQLLRDAGLAGVTTNALARVAGCSKDTLYLVFKNRDAILAALIERQATALNATFAEADSGLTSLQALTRAGERLLTLLTSDESLAINRAALADPTGALSNILIKAGKERSSPGIIALIERVHREGRVAVDDIAEAYRTFYGLLIGDRQILALHGALPARPTGPEWAEAAERAVTHFLRLYSPDMRQT